MNEHDDLERTVARSLRQRTERVSTSVPDLDGVWAHVDRRRNRRRHVAAVGSLAVVAVGALGITALGGGDPDRISAPAAGPDLQSAWRCTNQLDHFEEGSTALFFATCEPTEIDGTAPVFDGPTNTAPTTIAVVQVEPTVPVTVPESVVPNGSVVPTTGWCEQLDSDGGAAVSVPCTTMPADGTVFPTTTTTSIASRSPLEQSYLVRAGDSLSGIADRFGITIEQLVNYNEFAEKANHVLLPDDTIMIPPDAIIVDESPVPTTSTSVP